MLYNAFVHTIINYINNTSPGFLDLENNTTKLH